MATKTTPRTNTERANKIITQEANALIGNETGSSGKYNFPNAQMKLIEQDDEKRAFMAKVITNTMAFAKVGDDRVKTEDELCERLDYFFAECARTQQLPTVEKMCLCLGYDRTTINDWQTGRRKGVGPNCAIIIKKAKEILANIDAELAQEGKIQPVVYLFRSKNYYGLADKQEVVVTPNSQNIAEGNYEELQKRYAIPEEIDE